MKNIATYFKSLLGLGATGLILVVIAVVVGANAIAALMLVSGSFYDANDRLEVLVRLENDVRDDLQYIQLNEAYYAYSLYYGYEPGDELQQIADSFANINETLDILLEDGYFDPEFYEPGTLDNLQAFRQNLDAHQAYLDDSITALEQGSLEDADRVFFEMSDEASFLSEDLDALIRSLEEERQGFLLETPFEIADAMWMFSGSLLLVLVLGLMGYRSLAGYVDPVLRLRNAVNAITGDRYKPEILSGLTRRGGSIGHAARSIHDLAVHLDASSQSAKQEVEALRQALYESRRKRLRIFNNAGQPGENTEAGK